MTEILAKSTKFDTSQDLVDQGRMITKKGLFSDFVILEKCG